MSKEKGIWLVDIKVYRLWRGRCKLNAKKTIAHDDVTLQVTARYGFDAHRHGFDAVTFTILKYFVSIHKFDREKFKLKVRMVSQINFRNLIHKRVK